MERHSPWFLLLLFYLECFCSSRQLLAVNIKSLKGDQKWRPAALVRQWQCMASQKCWARAGSNFSQPHTGLLYLVSTPDARMNDQKMQDGGACCLHTRIYPQTFHCSLAPIAELGHQNLSLMNEKLKLFEIYTRCYFMRHFISSK